MSWTSQLRTATFARLPRHWQPAAAYHYYRARALLEPELLLACSMLRPGATVIDVGANEGVYTHAFARAGARVEAFEPQPACLRVLAEYARRARNVRVHGVALGDHEGNATLRVPLADGRPMTGHASFHGTPTQQQSHDVRVRLLDSFAFDDVCLIKIDVEGHELAVLRGATDTIRRCVPTLLVEIEQRRLEQPIVEAFDTVRAMGYDGSFLSDGELRPLEAFDPVRHQRPADADRPRSGFVNNFIFRPRAPRQG